MTIYFFDSSALSKRYVTEPGSGWVRQIAAPASENKIFIAKITTVEVVSALARRSREGSISPRTAHAARTYLSRHARREYGTVSLSSDVVQRAEDLLEKHALRAYDAIQLASALEINDQLTAVGIPKLTFVSADQRLLTVAQQEGLSIEDPSTHP